MTWGGHTWQVALCINSCSTGLQPLPDHPYPLHHGMLAVLYLGDLPLQEDAELSSVSS